MSSHGQLARKVRFGAQLEYASEGGVSGCKVLQVVAGTSTALKLQENDLILSIDNRPIASVEQFQEYFLEHKPGEEVIVEVQRGKKRIELKAAAVARAYETDDNA
jgi:S1-C subfamily serine protease